MILLKPQALECLNLKPYPQSSGDILTVVGTPNIIADKQWAPLATIDNTLLVYNQTTLAYIADGTAIKIATLPSLPRAASAHGKYIAIMTDAGIYYIIHQNNTFSDLGIMPSFRSIAIVAEYVDTFQATISACSIDNLSAAVKSAYREIADSARLAGAFIQPVIARCALLDFAGNIIHYSQPVCLSLPDGAPLTAAWAFGSDDGGATVRTQTFSAPAFRIRISIDDEIPDPWLDIVKSLQLQITPQFHPINFSENVTISFGRVSSTDNFIRVTLPGVQRGLSALRPIASAALLQRAVAHFSSIATTVATIQNPFSAAQYSLSVANPISVADEADNLAAALAKNTPAQISLNLSRLLLPHRFSASAVALNGDCLVWANINPLRFGGYSACAYAAAFESKHFSGFIQVDFSTGERLVTPISGNCAPTSWSPLIAYPSPEAVAMTIAISVDGDTDMRTLSVSLSPDATARFAIYISPSLAPIPVQHTAALSTPTPIDCDISLPGCIAAAANTIVPNPSAVASAADSIISIIPARTGSSAWEFRRSRFYAFTNQGIKLLTVDSSISQCAVNLLDSRVINNKYCAVDAGNAVFVLSASQLLKIAATTVKIFASDVNGDRIAWIPDDNEIIVANTDDNEATHFIISSPVLSYNSSLVALGPWLANAACAFAVTDDGLADLSIRNTNASTFIRWNAQITLDNGKRALPKSLSWMIKTSNFVGTLSVKRAWLTSLAPTPQNISLLSVSGAIHSPILCHLFGHKAIDVNLVIQANVSSDFALSSPLFN